MLAQNKETINSIIDDFKKTKIDSRKKNYELKTLGYITPWKKEGYKYVEKYAKKFDIISPCWYELKPEEIDGEFQIIIDGGSNFNSSLIKNLKKENPNIEILPRLHCSNMEPKIFKLWLNKGIDQFIKIFERRISYSKLDGFVFDCITFWSEEKLFKKFSETLLPKINKSITKLGKKLIVTIFPYTSKYKNMLDHNKFKIISKYVDYINVMTYDYPNYAESNQDQYYLGPISWIKQTIDYYVPIDDKNKDQLKKKILFGIPFHGFVFDQIKDKMEGNIDSKGFLQILQKGPDSCKLISKENEYDYYINANNEKIISYPIGSFIEKRLELSKELGLGGCGIWEIGNSNDYLLSKF